ncbi:XrtA system polysaccharide deacetylase [Allosphingosinicella indica]|uniref:Chitooligosaccharide deacetylase n=1 Tax=Allosphingosinicella indica TaxID=941907 RepID=A0A1X7GW62_9SPHN|nr:XrtA system polysaccharide deacetylase [Allosphingosinicella indica]SMF75465.1 polysaccharide deacetylase family protein, PEP-CTERM locus subfamily [Allosphingosinicella indica]
MRRAIATTPPEPIANALSVDVEDWFQVGAFERVIDRSDWDGLERRVEANTDAVLALFDEADVKATFFTLGWVAERHPALIRRIVAAGHEIASHGWDHKRVFTMAPREFRADLAQARAAIEDAAGIALTGYRAPSFSIDARTPWAHEILAEQGHQYSSSVAPVKHDHYGWPEAPRFAFRPIAGADMIELPVTTVDVAGRRFAAGGGGFFRVLPYAFSDWAIGRVNGSERRPAIFYFHPWEIDPDQPRVANAPLRSKLRHYTRLPAMRSKLLKLLKSHTWDRTDAVVAHERGRLS